MKNSRKALNLTLNVFSGLFTVLVLFTKLSILAFLIVLILLMAWMFGWISMPASLTYKNHFEYPNEKVSDIRASSATWLDYVAHITFSSKELTKPIDPEEMHSVECTNELVGNNGAIKLRHENEKISDSLLSLKCWTSGKDSKGRIGKLIYNPKNGYHYFTYDW